MNLAISNIAWQPAEEQVALELIFEKGIHHLEMAPTRYFREMSTVTMQDAKTVSASLSANGFGVVAFQALLFGQPLLSIFGSDKVKQATFDYLVSVLRVASCFGAKVIVFGSPRNRIRKELSVDVATFEAAEFFRSLGNFAREVGCSIGLEPNPTAYGADFMRDTAETLAVVEATNHPSVGIHLDSGILTMNKEDIPTAIQSARDRLVHFHVSEPDLVPVGTGFVNHRLIAGELKEIRYSHFVSVEMRSEEGFPSFPAIETACDLLLNTYA